jgi:hypothetical protein
MPTADGGIQLGTAATKEGLSRIHCYGAYLLRCALKLIGYEYRGRSTKKHDQIIKAIKLYLSIEVPIYAAPGRAEGRMIKQPLFRDNVASIE